MESIFDEQVEPAWGAAQPPEVRGQRPEDGRQPAAPSMFDEPVEPWGGAAQPPEDRGRRTEDGGQRSEVRDPRPVRDTLKELPGAAVDTVKAGVDFLRDGVDTFKKPAVHPEVQAFRDAVGYEPEPEKPGPFMEYIREMGGKLSRTATRLENQSKDIANVVLPKSLELQKREVDLLDPEEIERRRAVGAQNMAGFMQEHPIGKGALNTMAGTLGKVSQALLGTMGGKDEYPTMLDAIQDVNKFGLARGDSFKNRFFTEIAPALAVDTPLYIAMGGLTAGFGVMTGMNVLEQSLDKLNTGEAFDPDQLKTTLAADIMFKMTGDVRLLGASKVAAKELAAHPLRQVLGAGKASLGLRERLISETGKIATGTGILTGTGTLEQMRQNQKVTPRSIAQNALENLVLVTGMHLPQLAEAITAGRIESVLMKSGLSRADSAVLAKRMGGLNMKEVAEVGKSQRAYFGEAGKVNRAEFIANYARDFAKQQLGRQLTGPEGTAGVPPAAPAEPGRQPGPIVPRQPLSGDPARWIGPQSEILPHNTPDASQRPDQPKGNVPASVPAGVIPLEDGDQRPEIEGPAEVPMLGNTDPKSFQGLEMQPADPAQAAEGDKIPSGGPSEAIPTQAQPQATPEAPAVKTYNDMQAEAEKVDTKKGKTLLLYTQKNGKPYRKPLRVVVEQDLGEGFVRIARTGAGKDSRAEDVSIDRLGETPNVVSDRMRRLRTEHLDPAQRKQVNLDAREFNTLLYDSELFTNIEDVSEIEGQKSDRQRSMALSRHVKAARVRAAEMLQDPDADFDSPVWQSENLPKLKALIEQTDVQTVTRADSKRIRELKQQPLESFAAEDLPDQALIFKTGRDGQGEWFMVSKMEMDTLLTDGQIEKHDRYDDVDIGGMIEADDPAYAVALQEFKAQRAEEEADTLSKLDEQESLEPQMNANERESSEVPSIGNEAAPTESMEEWQQRNGVAPAPETEEMFGKGAVGDAFNLSQEQQPGQESFEERQTRESKQEQADQDQGALFDEDTPIKRAAGDVQRTGHPATHTAPGTRSTWAFNKPETGAGRKLVRNLKKDKRGAFKGVRSIVEFLNDRFDILMKESRGQTSVKNPANYRPGVGVVFTRAPGSQINFHEAGHRLFDLLGRGDAINKPLETTLMKFLDSGLAPCASAQNTSEAFAEWTRQFITNYDALGEWSAIETAVERADPKAMKALRDAARAFNAHLARDPAARFASESNDMGRTPGVNVRGAVNYILQQAFRKEHPAEAFVRSMQRAMKIYDGSRKFMVQTDRKAARAAMDWWKGPATAVRSAHAQISRVRNEVDFVFSGGTGKNNGVRVVNLVDPAPVYLTKNSFNDVRNMVPSRKWKQAQIAFQARVALDRFEKKHLDYAGIVNGITPKDLRAIVQKAKQEIPGFDKAFSALNEYYDALLDVAVLSGEVSPAEARKMKETYEHYIYLMPAFAPSGRPSESGEASAGFMSAKGSQAGYADVATAALDRTRRVLETYYEQQAKKSILSAIDAAKANEDLAWGTREEAARSLIPLKMKILPAASMSEAEQQKLISDYLLEEHDMVISPDDINLSHGKVTLFRPQKPNDLNVLTVFEEGKAKYYMAADPLMVEMYSSGTKLNPVVDAVTQELAAITSNFRRPITQSPVFGIVNAGVRDMERSTVRGEEKRFLVPYYSLTRGIVGRLAGMPGLRNLPKVGNMNHPELRNAAEMLSHSLNQSESDAVRQLGRAEIVKMLFEGWHNTSLPVNGPLRAVINVTHLANIINVPVKLIDVFHYTIRSRQMNEFFESMTREGAGATKLDTGGTLADALAAFSDVTGRFGSRPGNDYVSRGYRVGAFVNPGAQILYETMMDLTSPDAKVRNRVIGRYSYLVALGTAVGALKVLLQGDDDRDREDERSSEEKARYFDLMGLRLPFGSGFEGLAVNLGYTAVNELMSSGLYIKNRRKYAETLLKQTGQTLSVDVSLLPPLLDSMREAGQNWDGFFQSHIVSPYVVNMPPAMQYSASTPDFYRKTGAWMNYSPDKIQHIVRSGMASQIDEVIRMSARAGKGLPILGKEKADIPVVGRLFTRNPTGWRSESVKTIGVADLKYAALRKQLKDSQRPVDQSILAYMDGNKSVPMPRGLKTQLDALLYLHKVHGNLSKLSKSARDAGGSPYVEAYYKQQMVLEAQAALAGNYEFINQMEIRLKDYR